MKFSPLCTRDEGREIYFTARDDLDQKFRFTIPRAMLDEEVGAEADEAARKAWVGEHMPGILSAMTAREAGGRVKPPFNRVLMEELDG